MTHPSKAIEQAIEAFQLVLKAMDGVDVNQDDSISVNLSADVCHKLASSLIALRAMQSMKMRDAKEWVTRFPIREENISAERKWLGDIIKNIQQDAFTAGLMSRPDAAKIRNDAINETCNKLIKLAEQIGFLSVEDIRQLKTEDGE